MLRNLKPYLGNHRSRASCCKCRPASLVGLAIPPMHGLCGAWTSSLRRSKPRSRKPAACRGESDSGSESLLARVCGLALGGREREAGSKRERKGRRERESGRAEMEQRRRNKVAPAPRTGSERREAIHITGCPFYIDRVHSDSPYLYQGGRWPW